MSFLEQSDPEVFNIIKKEELRQQDQLSMIASENFFSEAVREAVGSVFMHKYSEGNIGQRYYQGNINVDELEGLAIDRARRLFQLPVTWDVNIQALAGSNANLAIYLALLSSGDNVLAMYLPDGGHLSHGWSFEPSRSKRESDAGKLIYKGGSRKVNITSRLFQVVQYKTDPATRVLDYDVLEKIAKESQPKLIITGGTAYPRNIDYQRVRDIADSVGALYLADIAHEAGLVAAGVVPSPVGIADIVSMTTHKTLRAGRGAIILARGDLIKKINRGVLPGLQGGPFNNNIAGICVGLGEALEPGFRAYAQQVIANAQTLARKLGEHGFELVSGGTDKHLLLIDLTNKPLFGKRYAHALEAAGIITNANTMPQDIRSPADPSALRCGTAWITTRGMGQNEMNLIAGWFDVVMNIASTWANDDFEDFVANVQKSLELLAVAVEVKALCSQFPLSINSVRQGSPIAQKS